MCANKKPIRLVSICTIFLLTISLTLISILFPVSYVRSILDRDVQALPSAPFDYRSIVERADSDYETLIEHIKYFSSLGSRFTSYPGFYDAAAYIGREFERYLTNVTYDYYNLTVFWDSCASLTVVDKNVTVQLYALLPNSVAFVSLPEEGLTGNLIYAGKGTLSELEGKKVEDAIVLMDFNSQLNWLNLAKLGAKMVIFIEPGFSTRSEAFAKYLKSVPFRYPRFYIKEEEARRLVQILNAESRVEVNVKASAAWEIRTAINIYGFIKGKTYPDNIVLICASYDSFSVVPAIAPGASEAGGIATLLTLARYFSEPKNQPSYTLLFVAFSGHNQGLMGSRDWIVRNLISFAGYPSNPPSGSLLQKLTAVFYLSLWPDTNVIYPLAVGGFHSDGDVGGWAAGAIPEYITYTYYWLNEQLGKDYGLVSMGQVGTQDQTLQMALTADSARDKVGPVFNYWMDNELFNYVARGWLSASVAFGTGRGSYTFYGSPKDTYDAISPMLENLKPQMEILYSWLYTYLNTEYLQKGKPVTSNIPWFSCWSDTNGKLVTWSITEGTYAPLQLDSNYTILLAATRVNSVGESAVTFTLCANDGSFTFRGIPSRNTRYGYYAFNAYVMDSFGNILYVDDQGQYKIPLSTFYEPTYLKMNNVTIAMFKCGSIVMFDLLDPELRDLTRFFVEISANYFDTHTSVASIHVTTEYYLFGSTIGILHVEPEKPMEILVKSLYATKYPFGILINATQENAEGYGYAVNFGQQLVIKNTALRFVEDMYALNEDRIRIAAEKGFNIRAQDHIKNSETIAAIGTALANYDYEEAWVLSLLAWQTERNAYINVRSQIEDSVNTVPFFGILAIPFSFILGKILVERGGRKNMVVTLALAAAAIGTLSFLHPGFRLASSLPTALSSFAILVLLAPIIAIVFNETSLLLKDVRRKTLGLHTLETAQIGTLVEAFSVGISYAKKRPLRMILTLLSITIMVFSSVIFTSVAPISVLLSRNVPVQAQYDGILVQRVSLGESDNYMYGVSENVVDMLKYVYKDTATICPRLWIWPTYTATHDFAGFLVENPNRSVGFVARALIGLSPDEPALTGIDAHILPGGRWFVEDEKYVCIIPEVMARSLGITRLPATVYVSGMPLQVIGIMSQDFDSRIDINTRAMTPIDLKLRMVPVSSDYTVIIPFEIGKMFLSNMGRGQLATSLVSAVIPTVGIAPKNASMITSMAEEIYRTFRLETFASHSGSIYLYTTGAEVSQSGWQMQLVTLIIVNLAILNLMLGSVYERTKELGVFSSLGLSPSRISFLFLAEFAIHGILGAVMGYLTAMATLEFWTALGFEAIFQNYSSLVVILSVGVSLVVILASGLYPMYVAAKLVTPSLERRWKIPTTPVKDMWTIPLPFKSVTDQETFGILEYFREFLDQHKVGAAKNFIVFDIWYKKLNLYNALALCAKVQIEPYELGVKQEFRMIAAKEPQKDSYTFMIELERESGTNKEWVLHNRTFIDVMRKQFLIWRSLKRDEKTKYEERAKNMLDAI